MRWIPRSLAAIVILWGFFAASPYLALYDLARAVERGDTALIAERVNFRALRISLAKELVDGYLTETDADGRITQTERQLATGLVSTLGEPVLGRLLTPEGLIGLLRTRVQRGESEPAPSSASGLGAETWSDLFALVARSQTRGFRTVYFVLPPRAPADLRFRIQLRLSRLSWKVVNLELPAELRRRLARQIAAGATPDLKR